MIVDFVEGSESEACKILIGYFEMNVDGYLGFLSSLFKYVDMNWMSQLCESYSEKKQQKI